ncbi:MAG: glycosyltransferase, partial [Sphingobacterium sp.]
MNKPIRILHVVTIMNLGGIETFLMTLYRKIDRNKIQFDFLVHRTDVGFFDTEIRTLGGNIFYQDELNPLKYLSYNKKLNLFFKTHCYNIVHSHLNANSAIVLQIAKKAGVPIRIAHSHIDKDSGGIKGLLKNISKNFINSVANYRFACSNQAGKWLFKDAVFSVFTNAIDTKKFIYDLDKRKEIRKYLK